MVVRDVRQRNPSIDRVLEHFGPALRQSLLEKWARRLATKNGDSSARALAQLDKREQALGSLKSWLGRLYVEGFERVRGGASHRQPGRATTPGIYCVPAVANGMGGQYDHQVRNLPPQVTRNRLNGDHRQLDGL